MDRRSALWKAVDARDASQEGRLYGRAKSTAPLVETGNPANSPGGASEPLPVIALRGVSKDYGNEVRALDDINGSANIDVETCKLAIPYLLGRIPKAITGAS